MRPSAASVSPRSLRANVRRDGETDTRELRSWALDRPDVDVWSGIQVVVRGDDHTSVGARVGQRRQWDSLAILRDLVIEAFGWL